MHPRRTPGERGDPVRADAAARRLALIAADLGAAPALDPTVEAWWSDHTRVAARRVGDEPAHEPAHEPAYGSPDERTADQGPPVAPPVLPVPGRHAARRRGLRWRAVVDRAAGARAAVPGLGPAHVAVVAILVALALAVTTWWVVRDDPRPVAAPIAGEPVPALVEVTEHEGATGGVVPSAGASDGGTVTVDVAGRVRRPGIVVLDAGARVTDALTAAGGARRGVDLTPLNLARVLVDGEQIVVGGPPPAGGAAAGGAGAPTGAAGPLVNLNLATQEQLEGLPQVGPVTAQSIIAWRDERGGFTSVDELMEVDGIGPKTFEQLRDRVTV